jgi:hypothetical protein
MKRARKFLLIVCCVVVMLIVVGAIYVFRPPNDGRTPAQRRQIADACFAMLHSPLTNELPVQPDDPRVPEIIRALHPIGITVDADVSVQIDFDMKPGEYFLMRLPGDTNTWILCAAGPTIPFGPREVLRVKYD